MRLGKVAHRMRRIGSSALLAAIAAICVAPAAMLSGQSSRAGISQSALRSPLHRAAAPHPLMVAYFPQWGVSAQPQYLVKNLLDSGSAALLDQIDYSQGAVTDGRCAIANPQADLGYSFSSLNSVNGQPDDPQSKFRGNFHQLQELKRAFPNLKIVISLEGRSSSFAQAAQPQNRVAFVSSCVDLFLRGQFAAGIVAPGVFDGVDIDWEFPRDDEDAANYLALLQEFRRQMDALRPGGLLTVAAGASPRETGADMVAVSRLADEIGIMTYDFTGPWSRQTGFVAPLYSGSKSPNRGSIDRSLAAYGAAGVPLSKLLIGVPFYGYGWRQVAAAHHGLFQSGHAIHADQPYWRIQQLQKSSKSYRDRKSRAPWLFDGDAFYTFDDPVSIRAKAKYARRHRVAGLMVWELSGDTADAELLRTAFKSLHKKSAASLVESTESLNRPSDSGEAAPGKIATVSKSMSSIN